MTSKTTLTKGLLLSVLIFCFLSTYSYLYEQSHYLQKQFKQINILPIEKDSLFRNLISKNKQTLINQKQYVASKLKQIRIQDSIKQILNYKGAKEGLLSYFQALDKLKDSIGTCRIAYYGDSMIEGDLMSMTLREFLQEKYGGQGIGYMPIVSKTNYFRINIKHDFSETWTTRSLLNVDNLSYPLGISGQYFIADTTVQENTVIYRARNKKFVNTFPSTKLFYGRNDSIDLKNTVVFNDREFEMPNTSIVNTLVLSNKMLKKADFNFKMKSEVPIYGVSFESNYGVLVDNFSLRGNSGLPMTLLKNNVLQSFNKEFDYDLIILQFGLNVLSDETNYVWYRAQMARVIKHFKKALPNASILVVSVPDVSKKNDQGEMKTNVSIIPIVEAQRKAAKQTGVSFFNLYNAMGGEDSMVKWVEELEYANKDYTHFNFKGARVASKMMFDFLENEYKNYKESIKSDE